MYYWNRRVGVLPLKMQSFQVLTVEKPIISLNNTIYHKYSIFCLHFFLIFGLLIYILTFLTLYKPHSQSFLNPGYHSPYWEVSKTKSKSWWIKLTWLLRRVRQCTLIQNLITSPTLSWLSAWTSPLNGSFCDRYIIHMLRYCYCRSVFGENNYTVVFWDSVIISIYR